MRYVIARIEEHKREMAYRYYITDSMYFMPRNQAPNERFYDLVNSGPPDTRSGDEIAIDIITRAGLVVNNANECI